MPRRRTKRYSDTSVFCLHSSSSSPFGFVSHFIKFGNDSISMVALDFDFPSLTVPPVPSRLFNLVASSARPLSSSGKSEMTVTPLPLLPFVSRPTRTTVDLFGGSGLQVHVFLSWWHFGQSSFRQSSFPIVQPFFYSKSNDCQQYQLATVA